MSNHNEFKGVMNDIDESIERAKSIVTNIQLEKRKLQSQNAKLIEALEFYEDFTNRDNSDGNGGMHDIGHKARETLKEIRGEE